MNVSRKTAAHKPPFFAAALISSAFSANYASQNMGRLLLCANAAKRASREGDMVRGIKILTAVLPVLSVAAIQPAAAAKVGIVYTFKGGADGAQPEGPLIPINGTLYGATAFGGSGCDVRGCGTLFSLTPDGVKQTLYEFKGNKDGSHPSGLVLTGNSIVGIAANDGATSRIFSFTPSGKVTLFGPVPNAQWPVPGDRRPIAPVGNTWYGVDVGTSSTNCSNRACGYIYSITPPQN